MSRTRVLGAAGLALLMSAAVPAALESSAEAGGVRLRVRSPEKGERAKLVRAAVKPWRSQLEACYDQLDDDPPRFQHRMDVRGRVDEHGALRDVQLRNTIDDEYVQECVNFVIDAMRLREVGAGPVQFQLRFNQH